MSLTRPISTSFFCALLALGPACGDDDGDGNGTGGPEADAAPEADASPGATHTGQALFLQGSFIDFPQFGQGALLETLFRPKEDVVAPSFEEAPGSPFACKVFEFTPEEYAPPGLDEGTMQFSVEGGPEFPPCNYVPGQGYRCIGVTGEGGDIGVVDAEMGLFSLSNPEVTFGADEVGRFVVISGSATASNNGQFPIVGANGDNTIVYMNPKPGAAEEAGTAATYLTLAGFGPAGQNEPVANDAQVTFEFTGGGEGHVGDFTRTLDIGDDFTLDTASAALLSDLPLDGSEFTIGCAGEGGECGTSMASILNIITTDATIPPGLPPVVLPPPETKAVQVFCIFLSGSATVPAEASQYIADSGATRIRSVFVRATPVQFTQDQVEILVAAGHAQAGFTNIAAQ